MENYSKAEKLRVATTARWNDPTQRARMVDGINKPEVAEKRSKSMKACWADPQKREAWLAKNVFHTHAPETLAKIKASFSTEEVKQKFRENGRRMANKPEFKAYALKGAKSPKKGEKTKRNSEKHPRAAHVVLRDPSGRVWHVRNILKFVRENEHLFAPEDVAWTGPYLSQCRIAKQLSNLWSKKPQTTVKGWTLVSKIEKVYNNGEDLIERQQYDIYSI
jgi:hypothetical protein